MIDKNTDSEWVTVFLSQLPGYEKWWEKHPDELDIVRESMDFDRIEMHKDELDSDHTELFEEMLEETREGHGL